MTDRAWMTHADFEARHPKWLAYAVGEAEDAARRGKKPRREFPCPGRIVGPDDGAINPWGECDECGFQVSFHRSEVEPEVVGEQIVARAELPLGMLERPYVKTPDTDLARSALRLFVERWTDERPKPPLLVGESGRGKTHLLTLAAVTIARRHAVEVHYWSAAGLLDALKRSYDSDGVCREWEKALDVPVLVLDDLGAERVTDWSRERVCTLLDHRYRKRLPVLSATNVPTGDWASEFGQRSASRLAGMTLPVRVCGPDWRQADDGIPSEGTDTNTSDDVL